MKLWRVWGNSRKTGQVQLTVKADSFDEAIAKGRKLYGSIITSGQVFYDYDKEKRNGK